MRHTRSSPHIRRVVPRSTPGAGEVFAAGTSTTRLLDALHHRRASVREAALTALGERRDPRTLARLIERFADRRDVRAQAIRAVTRFGAAAVGPLRAALDHEDIAVRVGALLALGELGRTSLLPLLVEHLKDRHSAIRFAARRALLNFGPRAAPLLAVALGSPSIRIRASVVAILRDFGAVAALAAALGHPSPRTRADAARALGAIGSPSALSALARVLDDESHPDVRHAAATALLERNRSAGYFETAPGWTQTRRRPGSIIRRWRVASTLHEQAPARKVVPLSARSRRSP